MSTLQSIYNWQATARPEPTQRDLGTALGCHFEEFAELAESLMLSRKGSYLLSAIQDYATALKLGEESVVIKDREGFLDAIADQIVTGVGVGYCAGMKVLSAVTEVDKSNWSKTECGKFLRDENGKITKGKDYRKPDLKGMF
jgi:hypothetical protein